MSDDEYEMSDNEYKIIKIKCRRNDFEQRLFNLEEKFDDLKQEIMDDSERPKSGTDFLGGYAEQKLFNLEKKLDDLEQVVIDNKSKISIFENDIAKLKQEIIDKQTKISMLEDKTFKSKQIVKCFLGNDMTFNVYAKYESDPVRLLYIGKTLDDSFDFVKEYVGAALFYHCATRDSKLWKRFSYMDKHCYCEEVRIIESCPFENDLDIF